MQVYMEDALTCRSNLPGRVKAGSRVSGKFVAASTIMPYTSSTQDISYIKAYTRLDILMQFSW